jgi:predicted RNA-binding Zn-ribbon protein involved in translation (DUF1610 family)
VSRRRQKRTERVHEPTAAEIAEQDLADAKERLEKAAASLVGAQVEFIASTATSGLSLYDELRESVSGRSGDSAGKRGKTSPPAPLWISAFSLLDEIDTAARAWSGCLDTPQGITELAARHWTTDETRQVTQLARAIEEWAESIEALLNPRSVQVRRECPACGGRHVYRRNSYGDSVRTATLQIDAEGVRCLSCSAHWTYAQSEFLRRLLEAEDQKKEADYAAA